MPRVLLTAFEPYDCWTENSSWSTLVDLTSWLDVRSTVVTRRYPVDLVAASDRLRKDLLDQYDFAIHLGQSPGAAVVKLETTGLNLRTDGQDLLASAPTAYRSPLPLADLSLRLREQGIPVEVSHHAGTYLCNAVLYLSQHFSAQLQLPTRSMFIHLPLTPAQVARSGEAWASCSTSLMAQAIELAIRWVESLPEAVSLGNQQPTLV